MLQKDTSKVFIVLLPLFLLLFSYKVVLFNSNLNLQQRHVVEFLQGEELLLDFTDKELDHLEDVKQVMKYVDIVFYVLLFLLSLIVTYNKMRIQKLGQLFRWGGIATTSLLGVTLGVTYFSFDFLFTFFHKIFFPQGNWQFPFDSQLIQTFPIEFFSSMSTHIFLLSLGFGIFFIGLGYYLKYAIHSART